jgi:hypothetical protein
MNSLTAHRVVIGILVVLLLALSLHTAPPWHLFNYSPLDGNPIGFNLWGNKVMNAALQTGSSTVLPACMSSNTPQCYMSVHYLQLSGGSTPACPPSSGNSTYYCPGGTTPQVLPPCPTSDLCIMVNVGNNTDLNSDMAIQSQDNQCGVHYQAQTIGELEFILGPTITLGGVPSVAAKKTP